MATTLQRFGSILVFVLVIALPKDVDAQVDKNRSVPGSEVERCIDAAQATCAKVATDMIAYIEETCGHFGLAWACRMARSYWNAPREQDAAWVNGNCQKEAGERCAKEFSMSKKP
ncbi:hypothetical protein [Variovorax sp. dw_954]|uniref:hypothetical protein n=1 Tax=Variovorax sp. dw_954 TaxID=2720078 RepID=UPI001BD39987|nr:hypothetical protein [Variovorax sp. dw_954]